MATKKERRHRLDINNTKTFAEVGGRDRYVIAARGFPVTHRRGNGSATNMTYRTLGHAQKAIVRIKKESKFDARIFDTEEGVYVQ